MYIRVVQNIGREGAVKLLETFELNTLHGIPSKGDRMFFDKSGMVEVDYVEWDLRQMKNEMPNHVTIVTRVLTLG